MRPSRILDFGPNTEPGRYANIDRAVQFLAQVSSGFPRPEVSGARPDGVAIPVRPHRLSASTCRASQAPGRSTVYPCGQMSPSSSESSTGSSIVRTIVAVCVLLVVGYFLLHVLIGVAIAVAGFVLVILAIVAVIWALRILF